MCNFDSYHEIGTIDMRYSIDHILGITGKQRLIYIGFSMGTSESYVLLSTYPEYNQKISLCVSLAPVASFESKPPLFVKLAAKNLPVLQVWLYFFVYLYFLDYPITMYLYNFFFFLPQRFVRKYQYYEILPHSSTTKKLGRKLCDASAKKKHHSVCSILFKSVLPVMDLSRFNEVAKKFI